MRRCVRSRNLKNEEAMTRVGPQRHRKQKKKLLCGCKHNSKDEHTSQIREARRIRFIYLYLLIYSIWFIYLFIHSFITSFCRCHLTLLGQCTPGHYGSLAKIRISVVAMIHSLAQYTVSNVSELPTSAWLCCAHCWLAADLLSWTGGWSGRRMAPRVLRSWFWC